MEAKKSEKANLENKKGLFLELGLIVALAIVLFAFEMKSYDKQESSIAMTEASMEVEEMVIQTQQDEPEPPKQEVELSQTEFEIVENDVEIKDEFKLENFDNITDGSLNVNTVEIKQEVVEDDEEREIFQVVEQTAMFPGGLQELNKYLAQNIKYPQQARETGTQGKVFLTFVVEKDGSITDIKVLRDIGSGCGEEAIRVVKSMPKWTPAKQRGKTVRQQFNLPVNFTLQ
ncbi:MAG: energy transducer TonB [Bacteroidales bacterium]|nr:energy transducer TonB [Bacteroidales bacterium]